MKPDPIGPSFAEQTDTPKVVGSRNEVLAQVHRPATGIGVIGAYFWPTAATLAVPVRQAPNE
jgi:hypothetical protein